MTAGQGCTRVAGGRPSRSRRPTRTAAQCGAFLDSIENDRLYAAYQLAAYWGQRRSELEHLEWPDVDLATRRVHVRGDVKSEDSDRIITIDSSTARVLEA